MGTYTRSWSGSDTYIQYDRTGINVRRYWPDSQWAGSRTSQDRVLPRQSGPRVNAEAEKPEWELTEVSYMWPRPGADKKVSPQRRSGCVMGYCREVPRTAEEGGPSDRPTVRQTRRRWRAAGGRSSASDSVPAASHHPRPLTCRPTVHDQLRELAFAEPVKMHSILMEGLDLVFRAGPQAIVRTYARAMTLLYPDHGGTRSPVPPGFIQFFP